MPMIRQNRDYFTGDQYTLSHRKMFECENCSLTFEKRCTLNLHRRRSHNLSPVHTCEFCNRNCKSRSELSRHAKKCNPEGHVSPAPVVSGKKCGACGECFPSLRDLCQHVQTVHGEPAVIQQLEFSTEGEFNAWKELSESNGRFEFIRVRKPQETAEHFIDYLQCHRSGSRASTAEQRAPKALGSIKVGHTCTAFAIVRRLKDQTEDRKQPVCATFCLYHHMHDNLLARTHLPDMSRRKIAEMVEDGRPTDWILTQMRNDLGSDDHGEATLERWNIVTRTDVSNIIKSLGLRTEEKDTNDYASVSLWVEMYKDKEFSPFFAYLPQNAKGEFCLGIQTSFQREMLQKLGDNVICMDATHGTQRYKFLLVTVLVLDEFGKGLPVAWAIVSNETEELLTRFLCELRIRTGPIKCKLFMSDDAPQYYNSWAKAYTDFPKKLLCTWHVHRNWAKAILKISTKDADSKLTRSTVSKELDVLLRTTDAVQFQSRLVKFFTLLEERKLSDFANYFRREYCATQQRIEEWAYFARVGSPINVNTFVESFHRVLKEKFLLRKENLRLDSLIASLMANTKWYFLENVVNRQRGRPENSFRLKETHKRHIASRSISPEESVTNNEDGSWTVKSASKSGVVYNIRRVNEDCTCFVRCSWCKVCPDMYTCSCPDAIFTTFACKHVHMLHTYMNGDKTVGTQAILSEPEPMERHFDLEQPSEWQKMKEKTLAEIRSLYELIESTDASASVHKNLQEKLTTMKNYYTTFSDGAPVRPHTEKVAPNKIMQTQQRFVCVRRKRSRDNAFGRPTEDEVREIDDRFASTEAQVCGKCHLKNDASTNSASAVRWIQCDRCDTWFHLMCVQSDVQTDAFLCRICCVIGRK